MMVTQSDARKILSRLYPDTPIRLTTRTQIMNVPVAMLQAGIPMLAWRKLTAGPSMVRIGRVHGGGLIHWEYDPFENYTLADHAEAWAQENGETIPARDSPQYKALYERWHAYAFADLGSERKL